MNGEFVKRIKGSTIWFTGLSASGKSTMANILHKKLAEIGVSSVILDADEIRKSINSDLGYSLADREENNRRVAEIARLINKSGIVVLAAFISPTERIRTRLKEIIGNENFFLVYIDTPLEVCEKRDKKSLYIRARQGVVKDFSGISSLFEIPSSAEIIIDGIEPAEDNALILLRKLEAILIDRSLN